MHPRPPHPLKETSAEAASHVTDIQTEVQDIQGEIAFIMPMPCHERHSISSSGTGPCVPGENCRESLAPKIALPLMVVGGRSMLPIDA